MLHLYDLNHNKIKGLKKYKDYHIKSVLSTADKTLYFSYPLHLSKDIFEECYIRNKEDEFVVKQIGDGEEGWINITATLNVETLEGKEWKSFETVEATIEDSLNLAFAGTGWIVNSSSITKKRTIRMTNTDSWKILQQAIKTYRCEIKLDSINKTVTIKERIGEDKGVYLTDTLNVISLNANSNTNEFYTRMVALGKTTKTGEGDDAVESTLEVIVENHQYSNKIKTIIWKDERYTDEASLREDATYKLDEISKPYRSYNVSVYDLANMNPIYQNILSYDLGDTVTLISNNRNFKDKQRIVSIDKYPDEPDRNSCELGNVTATFDQIQKEKEEVSNTVNNITSDNGTISSNAIKDAVVSIVGTLNVNEINAIKISVGKLEATVAEINTAYIDKAYIDKLMVNYATIANLEAALAKIGILEADYATIQELLAGHITSGNIQSGSITGDSLNMKTIFVSDANILDLTAGKITSGSLDTSKVTIQSKNGNIIIADATQQFKDNAGNLRLQLGQDAKGDFNFILYDATGNGVLIDSTGIKESAIADGMIKGEMIGEGQIGGTKINWTSFVQEFNKDTNTNSILASKILVDGTNQTVGFHLNKLQEQISTLDGMNGDVSGVIETVSSHTTQLNMQQGQIDTLIQNTTITKNGQTTTLKDEYNKTVDTVNSHTSTIASHTSSLNSLDGTIQSVDSKVNEVKKDLDGTKSTVSATSTKVTELEKTVSSQGTSISQLNNQIALKVEHSDITNAITPLSTELQQLKTDTKSDIAEVNERVNGIITDVGGAVKDGIIDEAETIIIANSIDALNREKKDIDTRYTAIYANSNLKGATKTALNTKYTAYNTAHTNLINNINSMIADKVATESEKIAYKTKLNEYSNALSQLSEAFDSAINNININDSIAKDEELKSTLQGNINEVKGVADGLKTQLGNYTADGILDEAEKESVRTHLKSLATEKADVDKEYITLYSNTDLVDKTNLKTAYDNYVLKYNDLVTNINTLLNASAITDAMRTNINNAFSVHDSYLATYSQRVNEAFTAISEKKKQDAISTSQAYYNTQIVIDKNSIMNSVSESYTSKTDFNNLQIGGRNLIPNSKLVTFQPNNTELGISVKMTDEKEEYMRATPASGNSVSLFYIHTVTNGAISGETYIISLMVRSQKDANINLYYNSYEGLTGKTTNVKAGVWTRISTKPAIFTKFDGAEILMSDVKDSYLDYKLIKLEKGNKATDWTAAPEDLENSITSLGRDLQTQIDGKIETFNQATDPSTAWTTTTLKNQHIGDLWYNTSSKITYRWDGTIWTKLEDSDAINAQSLAQNKKRIFTSTPTTPYDIGDLWVTDLSSSGDIKVCKYARSTGNYTSTDWVNASKYTDDTYAKSVDSKLTQTATSLTATFTQMHNGGYEQGITKIDKEGITVSHSNAATTSKMSADGYQIVGSDGENIAWLSSKKQWTELKADKVYATNIATYYEGPNNLYVNWGATTCGTGTSSSPLNSFAVLGEMLNNKVLVDDLTINITSSVTINEQLYITGVSGRGEINIIYNSSVIHACSDYCVALTKCTNPIVTVIGGRTSYSSTDGARLQSTGSYGGVYGAYNTQLRISSIRINVSGIGIRVLSGILHMDSIDFCKSVTAVQTERSARIYDASNSSGNCTNAYILLTGSILVIGTGGTGRLRPVGAITSNGGIIQYCGASSNIATHESYSYPSSTSVPSTSVTTTNKIFVCSSFNTYQYNSSTWAGDGSCKQGAWGYGLRGGHMFFNITDIRNFIASGTVQSGCTITLTRANSGGNCSPSKVYLCNSSCGSANGTPSYSNQVYLGTLDRNETKAFNISTTIINALKSSSSSLAVYVNSTASDCYINITAASLNIIKK